MEHKIEAAIGTWCIEGNEMAVWKDEIIYGVEVFLSTIWKLMGFLIIGVLFDCLFEMVVSIASFSSVRYYAGGRHQNTSLKCFLSMLLICLLPHIVISGIRDIPVGVLLFLLLVNYVLISKYAPYTSEKYQMIYSENNIS